MPNLVRGNGDKVRLLCVGRVARIVRPSFVIVKVQITWIFAARGWEEAMRENAPPTIKGVTVPMISPPPLHLKICRLTDRDLPEGQL
jgi:hypothetical protein